MQEHSYPCPQCEYDLRGLEGGRCPECGHPFLRESLQPEIPGLPVERWLEAAETRTARMLLPLGIAAAPGKGFQPKCRLSRLLTTSPQRVLVWMLLCYVVVSVICLVLEYVIGIVFNLADPFRVRFTKYQCLEFPLLLPYEIARTWICCLAVSVAGVVLTWKPISVSQLLRLSVWLFPFAYVAVLGQVLIQIFWLGMPTGFLALLPWEVASWLSSAISSFALRALFFLLGVFAGWAVGTLFGRRRLIVAGLCGILLYWSSDVLLRARLHYRKQFSYPLCELALGPPPPPPPPPTSPIPATFTAGPVDQSLFGDWNLTYLDDETKGIVELRFDEPGALVQYRDFEPTIQQSVDFLVDGQTHELKLDIKDTKVSEFRYTAECGGNRTGREVVIYIRVRMEGEVEARKDVSMHFMVSIDEKLVGSLSADGNLIEGRSHRLVDSAAINALQLTETPFIIRRITEGDAPSDAVGP
ncbi:MAG: hypothetical protein JSV78_14355 [Phycisphaerales bacterium]|nr:MAG: hypothetical protein JSV78_14355 [Phycisphaerales bacterium]